MSIKLYSAYRIKLAGFDKFLNTLRSTLEIKLEEKLLELLAERSIHFFDAHMANIQISDKEEKYKYSSISRASGEIHDSHHQVKKTGRRDPGFDLECDISFIFNGNFVYFIVFTEVNDYKDIIENLKNVEDYSYWNNTDRPENIPSKVWSARRRKWDQLLKKAGIPALAGLNFELIGRDLIKLIVMNKDGIMNYIPSFEHRCMNMARMMVTFQPKENEEITHHDVLDFLMSPEYKIAVKQKAEELKSVLKQDVTMDDLKIEY